MSGDRVGKVLERVAMECVGEVIDAYGLGKSTNDACAVVLEERLGPLLRAGQVMRECGGLSSAYYVEKAAWDAALATLEREK